MAYINVFISLANAHPQTPNYFNPLLFVALEFSKKLLVLSSHQQMGLFITLGHPQYILWSTSPWTFGNCSYQLNTTTTAIKWIFIFSSFDKQGKNHCLDPLNIEYTENGLTWAKPNYKVLRPLVVVVSANIIIQWSQLLVFHSSSRHDQSYYT